MSNMNARREEAITVANRVMVDETHSVFPWARVATAVVDAVIPVLTDELSEEYVLVYDGDPMMDGTHERRETGRFTRRADAERGYIIVSERSVRAPKPNLRIERRLVGPWEVVE